MCIVLQWPVIDTGHYQSAHWVQSHGWHRSDGGV